MSGNLGPSTLPLFSPPGSINELTDENKAIWSKNFIAQWMNDEIAGNEEGPYGTKRTPLEQFFNGTITAYETGQTPTAIQWTAFPRKVSVAFPGSNDLRWKVADSSRIFQDEYLEWSIARDENGKIISVTYTCEGPEYWSFLASVQRDTAVGNIYELNKPYLNGVTQDQFFLVDPLDPENQSKWVYNPANYYNFLTTTGTITHLIQPNNTLSAEIDIAAQATVIRKDKNDKIITSSDQLIRCSQYGNPDRNSDPTIGAKCNGLARQGYSISIADPVALYINSFDTSNFKLDVNGDQSELLPIPDGTFNFQRGDISKMQGLRLKIQIPDGVKNKTGVQMTVSDIYDVNNNVNIQYGAQFTDYIQMGVAGVAITGGKPSPAQYCPQKPSAAGVEKIQLGLAKAHLKRGGHSVKPHRL